MSPSRLFLRQCGSATLNPPTAAAVGALFGEHVVDIVRQCSDDDPESSESTPANWRVRKDRYVNHLREAPREVLLVSLADKLYNAR